MKEHAWKLIPLAGANAHETPPTHFRFNDFRNIDVRRRVPVNDGVAPGFRGVCDTVLTQIRSLVTVTSINAHRRVHESTVATPKAWFWRGRFEFSVSEQSVSRDAQPS